MTLRELHYFIAVYQETSITKAADRLYVVPSVISTALKKLENDFDVELFSRSANRITPTAAGDHFYKRALDIMNDISALKHEMRSFQKSCSSKEICHIGISATLLSAFGEEISNKLIQAFPDVRFDIQPYQSILEEKFYQQYDITLALTYSGRTIKPLHESDAENYTIEQLASFHPYIWISSSSPLQNHKYITYEMLKDYTFISYNGSVIFTGDPTFFKTPSQFQDTKLKSQLITSIEELSYYTSDLPLQHGKLTFQDLFEGHAIKPKMANEISYIELIYRKNFAQNFIPLITLTLHQLMNPEDDHQ